MKQLHSNTQLLLVVGMMITKYCYSLAAVMVFLSCNEAFSLSPRPWQDDAELSEEDKRGLVELMEWFENSETGLIWDDERDSVVYVDQLQARTRAIVLTSKELVKLRNHLRLLPNLETILFVDESGSYTKELIDILRTVKRLKTVEADLTIPKHLIGELAKIDTLENLRLELPAPLPSLSVFDGSRLKSLDVNGGNTETVNEISAITTLEKLRISRMAIMPGSLDVLGNLSELRLLAVSSCETDGQFMEHLVSDSKLKILEFRGCPVDDEALESIGKLRSLNRLLLLGTGITGNGLHQLARLELNLLGLDNNELDLEAVEAILGMKKVKCVRLYANDEMDRQLRAAGFRYYEPHKAYYMD